MEVNFELEKNDLIEFSDQFAKTQTTHKPLVGFLTTIVLIFIFADLFYLLISGFGNFNSFGEILFSIFLRTLISFGLLGLFVLIARLFQKYNGNKIERIENNGILCEHKIVFNENEFIEITDVNTSKHSWLSVGSIKEIDDFVLIDVNFAGVHFIPKRYFNNPQHIKDFVETGQFYHSSAKEKFNSSHLANFERKADYLNEGDNKNLKTPK